MACKGRARSKTDITIEGLLFTVYGYTTQQPIVIHRFVQLESLIGWAPAISCHFPPSPRCLAALRNPIWIDHFTLKLINYRIKHTATDPNFPPLPMSLSSLKKLSGLIKKRLDILPAL